MLPLLHRLRGGPPGVGLGAVHLEEGGVRVRVAVARVGAQLRVAAPALRGGTLVERFDIEPYSDFSAK